MMRPSVGVVQCEWVTFIAMVEELLIDSVETVIQDLIVIINQFWGERLAMFGFSEVWFNVIDLISLPVLWDNSRVRGFIVVFSSHLTKGQADFWFGRGDAAVGPSFRIDTHLHDGHRCDD